MERFVLLPNELQSMVMRYVPFPQACVFLEYAHLRDVLCRTLRVLDLEALKKHERSYVCKTLSRYTIELPFMHTIRLRTWRNPIKSLVLPQLHTMTLYQANLSDSMTCYVLTLPHLHTLHIHHLGFYRPNDEVALLRREKAKAWLHITIGRSAIKYVSHLSWDLGFLPMVASVFVMDWYFPETSYRLSTWNVEQTLESYVRRYQYRLRVPDQDMRHHTVWIWEDHPWRTGWTKRKKDGHNMMSLTKFATSPPIALGPCSTLKSFSFGAHALYVLRAPPPVYARNMSCDTA